MQTHYPYSQYLNQTFGGKTYKIVVSSQLSCPTRDGKISEGGCAFCDVRGSSSFFGKKGKRNLISEQIKKRLPEVQSRFGASKFLAYFQSYTNTYSDITYLRDIYEQALSVPEVSGLCIGTRPDCLSDEVIDLLEEMAQKKYVSLELGVQSLEDETLNWLKRGHDAQCSLTALERLSKKAPHVHTCVHLMFGSPTDQKDSAKKAAQILSQYSIRGVKLHQLMVLKNTELEKRFLENQFEAVSIESYAKVLMDFITHLSPSIYIERLYATATHKDECLAPEWSKERWKTHNFIRDYLESHQCKQGALFSGPLTNLNSHLL